MNEMNEMNEAADEQKAVPRPLEIHRLFLLVPFDHR